MVVIDFYLRRWKLIKFRFVDDLVKTASAFLAYSRRGA